MMGTNRIPNFRALVVVAALLTIFLGVSTAALAQTAGSGLESNESNALTVTGSVDTLWADSINQRWLMSNHGAITGVPVAAWPCTTQGCIVVAGSGTPVVPEVALPQSGIAGSFLAAAPASHPIWALWGLPTTAPGAAGDILISNGAGTSTVFTTTPTFGVQSTTQGTLTLAGSAGSPATLSLDIAGASANPLIIQPGANSASVTLTGPTASGTIPSTAMTPVTLSAAGVIACSTCATTSAGGTLTVDQVGSPAAAVTWTVPVNDTITITPATSSTTEGLIVTELSTTSGLRIGTGTTDPSTLNAGDIWINTSNIKYSSNTNVTQTVPVIGLSNAFTGATNTFAGSISAATFLSATKCSSGASPAVCSAAPAGSVAVPTGTNPTLVVNTTAVTTSSQIFLQTDESASVTSTTCNTTGANNALSPVVTARTGGTSFTIGVVGTISTNPVCVHYLIVN